MSNPDRAWTAEQVEAMAEQLNLVNLASTEHKASRMLRAYAATLRQQGEQAGGVVSDKLQRVYKAARGLCHGYDWNKGTAAKYHRAELLASVNDIEPVPDAGAKIEAALAQNAQGEAVAWLSIDSIGERYLCFTKPNDNDPCYPLYLHAERARVPAGWRETILAVIDALDKATGDSDPNIDPDMTDKEVRDEYPEVWSMQQLTAMLAAPSQPEDAA